MKLSSLSLTIIKFTIIISIIAAIPVFFFVYDPLGFAISLFAGLLGIIIKLFMVEFAINKITNGESNKNRANMHMASTSIIRFFLVLTIATLSAFFFQLSGIIGSFIPFISLQISVYISNFFEKNTKKL